MHTILFKLEMALLFSFLFKLLIIQSCLSVAQAWSGTPWFMQKVLIFFCGAKMMKTTLPVTCGYGKLMGKQRGLLMDKGYLLYDPSIHNIAT